jgi:hypothetical protein
MWKLECLIKHCGECSADINHRWVPARPINYKHRSVVERIKEAFLVFIGAADCFLWPEGQ